MSLTRFILPGIMLGLVLSLTPSVAKAGVVYGNLGSTGDSPTVAGDDAVNVSSATRYAAAGFNTGAATFGTLKLNSVTLALSASTTASSIQIWSSTGSGAGANPGILLGFDAVASSVTNLAGNLYEFSFSADPQSGVQLAANTDYWVVIQGATGLFWEAQQSATSPVAQTGSTYASLTNFVRSSSNSGTSWTTPVVQTSGISINAVPEPSTYVMAGIGAGLAGLAQLRRRRSL